MPTQIVVIGYYGHNNFGDEWLLIQSLKWVQKHYKSPQVTVTYTAKGQCADYLTRHFNAALIERTHPVKLIKAVFGSDLVLFGGGGLLQNKTSQLSLLYYLAIVSLGQLFQKKVILLAQGIGPISGKFSNWLTAKLLNRCTAISLRDAQSMTYLKDHQIQTPALKTADLGFWHATPNPSPSTHSGPAIIGLSLRESPALTPHIQLISDWINSIPNNWVFLDCHPPNDFKTVQQLGISPRKFRVRLNLTECLIKNSTQFNPNIAIVMRYHAGVWCALNSIPFLALSYDIKVSQLAKALNQPVIDLSGPITRQTLLQAWDTLTTQLETYKTQLEQGTQKLIENAALNNRLPT